MLKNQAINKYLLRFNILLFSLIYPAISQTVTGHIYDTKKNPLPGANIYIENTNIGSISNKEGYYVLKLPEGINAIIYNYIGYLNDTLEVDIKSSEKLHKDIYLKEFMFKSDAILVFAEKYNDAQEIILKTIENKNKYLASIQNYEYDAYHKTVFWVTVKDSQKIIGGILETKSKGYYKSPDKFQEVILAKRQTANFSDVTNVFAVGKIPNLLEETIILDELTVVTPLNKNALDFYHFEMSDTTYYNKRMVFNMTFHPRISNIPLFSGKISIIDKDFAVVYCELDGMDRVTTKLRDKIKIHQRFRQYENKYWFPTEVRMNCRINLNLPGVPLLDWNQHGLISNYRINIEDFDHVFDNTILSYSILAEEERENLWKTEQAIPLNIEEEKAVQYIDSVVTNASIVKKAIFKIIQNFDKFLITGIYDFYHYNRVEGNSFGIGFDSKRKLPNKRLMLRFGYGREDRKYKYGFFIENDFISEKLSTNLEFYNRLSFLDKFYRYNNSDISFQTLLFKDDYADYFYEKGIKLGMGYRILEHLKFGVEYNLNKQSNAANNAEWSLSGKNTPFRSAFEIDEGNISGLEFTLISDNLKFFDYGWLLIPDLSQDFFDIKISAFFSSKKYLKSDFNFEQYHLFMNMFKKFPPYINIYLRVSGGVLEGDKPIQNYFHLAGAYGSFGNPILFRTITSDQFLGDRYFAFSIENNFKNTIFSLLHLPYFQKSKLDLLIFSNIGWVHNINDPKLDNLDEYNKIRMSHTPLTEVGVSIGNIFTFFRVDFTWRTNYKTGDDFNIKLTSRLFVR